MRMERSGVNTALVLLAAAAVGFVIALLIFGNDNGNNAAVVTNAATTATTTTTNGATSGTGATTTTQATTAPGATPTNPPVTTASCIALWNSPANRGAQTFLINIASQQPIRVHVGETTDVPPRCLITVLANNGDAYVFPEAGGTTYATAASRTSSASLPAAQRT